MMIDKKTFLDTVSPNHGPQHKLIAKISKNVLFDIVEKYVKGGKLLDIGCGTKPYAELFKERVDSHIGFDHESCIHEKNNVDVFGDIYNMPFENNSFDYALSTAVLEHLEEPQQAVNETFRVLKDGGIAIYSIPLFFYVHEAPRDFYRFTEHGIRYIFKKSGFEICEIIPLSGFWTTFGTFLSYNILADPQFESLRQSADVKSLIDLLLYKAESMDNKHANPAWTWSYYVVAQKKVKNSVKSMQYIYDYSPELHKHLTTLKENKHKDGYVDLVRPLYAGQKEKNISTLTKSKIIKYALNLYSISYEEYQNSIDNFYKTRHQNTDEQCVTQEKADKHWFEAGYFWNLLNIHCQFSYYTPMYDCIVKRFAEKKQMSICDFGSGTGAFALALRSVLDVEKLTLLDLETQNSDYIKYVIEKEAKKNIYFADILQEHNEEYDLVLCFDVLEHLEKSYEALQRLKNLVKPNGYLMLKIAFEVDSKTHLAAAAEDFFITNNGLAYLEEHFIPLQDFPESNQLVCTLYKRKAS